MANTTTKSNSEIELLDQMLDDLVGQEFSDFEIDTDLSADLDITTDTDDFTMIDGYH